MEQNGVKFYKLNKSKRYGVEGTNFKIGDAILIAVVLAIFLSVLIALIVINFDVLFHDACITAFTFGFIAIFLIILAVICSKYIPLIKRRKHARKILKNCTLTDGTVEEIVKHKRQYNGRHHSITYYRILLEYSFHGPDGTLHYAKYTGDYTDIPFFVGQNLMIAFNDTDSVIMNKFTLSEGAEEFAGAEEERCGVDFNGLTGNLIKVDTSKPIFIADYTWSLFLKTSKRKKRLKQILEGAPRFTVGRYFIKKNTYRFKAGNNQYYCYISENGSKRVEECAGIWKMKDGAEVMVAYGDGMSEIISNYTLKKTYSKQRRKKAD